MTFPSNPNERLPRGDKNRRLSLGVDRDAFASEADVTVEQLHDYEFTQPDQRFNIDVARHVGVTLERLEATRTPRVYNGAVPANDLR